MKNGKITKQVKTYICTLFVFLCIGFILAFTTNKLKAETSYYVDLSSNYIIDYSNAPNYSNNDDTFTMTNNYDGTFTFNGTTSAVRKVRIPLTEKVIDLYLLHATIIVGQSNYPVNGTGTPRLQNVAITIETSNGDTIANRLGAQTSSIWGVNGKRFFYNYSSMMSNGNDYTTKWQDPSTTKYICYTFPSNFTLDNLILCPIILHNLPSEPTSGDGGTAANQIVSYNYFLGLAGPKQNDDVYYATTKPQAGYYIYQKVNAQLGINLLPAIRYTLTAGQTILSRDIAIELGNDNIDVLKLTAPNGNIYRVYYDNITSSNTKDSYFVDDNGTTTILQNSDGSGDINQPGLDALILALQHALTYNAVITSADHYIFNLCSYSYVFDTDFGYAKGVQEGSANYQPGQPGYQTIYNAGKDYGEQQKDTYYNNYYGGSNGIGGAGYTGIYNAGKEAGARITTNWLYEILNTIVVVFGLELLPGIKLGYIVGAPVVISTIWFIIRQFSGGKNE